ncbi:hypothetical protein [Shouchella lonarensis]|uniref:HicB family protein n=1 Tax=Shouchella lonarensis TaxID=1464122 RepID=A0A1G6GGX3_9BACI|nr:hypothetical protein [Shouchella lonarensis]SDB81139.1 hypothetical protein SAMN05421737_10127 [Shouchella lonarensis]
MNQCEFRARDHMVATDYHWRVRKVFNWCGGIEYMIELLGREECIGFGNTMREARRDLEEAMGLYELRNGTASLPEVAKQAQIIVLEPSMTLEEMSNVNENLLQFKEM